MYKVILPILAAALLVAACDKDKEFDTAKVAKAPEATEPATATQPNSDLPPDHPPIGAAAAAGQKMPPARSPSRTDYASPAEFGKKGPLRWTAPEGWQPAKPATAMRLAEYVVPGPKGKEPAVLSVFHFGRSGGGGVGPNVKRWLGQFKTKAKPPVQQTKKYGSLTVHLVDVTGTYDAGMAANGAPPKKNQRLLGAIVESPAGLFFFKLVGPNETVSANEQKFESFLKSLKTA